MKLSISDGPRISIAGDDGKPWSEEVRVNAWRYPKADVFVRWIHYIPNESNATKAMQLQDTRKTLVLCPQKPRSPETGWDPILRGGLLPNGDRRYPLKV